MHVRNHYSDDIMNFTRNYNMYQNPIDKRVRALVDIRDYLGVERFIEISANFVDLKIAGTYDDDWVYQALSFAGIEGYPAVAFNQHLTYLCTLKKRLGKELYDQALSSLSAIIPETQPRVKFLVDNLGLQRDPNEDGYVFSRMSESFAHHVLLINNKEL